MLEVTVDGILCRRKAGGSEWDRMPTVVSNHLAGVRLDGRGGDSSSFFHEHMKPFDEEEWLHYGHYQNDPVSEYSDPSEDPLLPYPRRPGEVSVGDSSSTF